MHHELFALSLILCNQFLFARIVVCAQRKRTFERKT